MDWTIHSIHMYIIMNIPRYTLFIDPCGVMCLHLVHLHDLLHGGALFRIFVVPYATSEPGESYSES